MRTYAIVDRQDECSKQVADQLRMGLGDEFIEDCNMPEIVFAIGGDGTFLMAVHQYLNQLEKVAFIGVHTGTLGFMTDYNYDQVDELIHDVKESQGTIDELRLLETSVENDPHGPYYALNEMRIENAIKTQILDIYIDNQFFETYRGTGICLATQMGSTAYNRSIKGAVIQHGLPLLELSEIAGIHHRAYQSLGNSIILKEETELSFTSETFEGAILCYDHCSTTLHEAKKIECRNSNKSVRIIRYHSYHYFTRLKNLF